MQLSHQSPLGRKISEYLQKTHPTGLTVSEVYDRLVADTHYGGTKQMIVDLLAGHPDVYAKGPGGRWLDATLVAADGGRVHVQDEGPPGTVTPPQEQPASAEDRPPQRPGRFQDCYVVFDLETLVAETMEQRRIIEISALKFVDGKEVDSLQTFVNPGQEIDPVTENRTHISSIQVADRPPIEAILPQFVAFIGDLPLVAHNGRGFDLPILNHWCRFHGFPEITNNLLDTLDLSLILFPTEPILNLSRVNELLGLAPFPAHRAEADVAALAEIFRHLLQRMAAQPSDVRKAINAFYVPFVLCDDTAEPISLSPASRLETPLTPHQMDFTPYASAKGVRSIFAPGGILAERLGPGYEDRPSQTDMAELTWLAFANDQYWLIEAPTGTGKTNAYLFPSIVWALTTGQRVFISAHTRQLQDQIRQAIEAAQGMGFPVRYAVLKGARTTFAGPAGSVWWKRRLIRCSGPFCWPGDTKLRREP